MNTTESPFKNTIDKDTVKQILVDISELMLYKSVISEIVDIDQGNDSFELIAVKLVLDEVLNDACSWVSYVTHIYWNTLYRLICNLT